MKCDQAVQFSPKNIIWWLRDGGVMAEAETIETSEL